MPSITSGVTTMVTQGMASRLASSPTNDTWPNNTSTNGVSAQVTSHCSRHSPRAQRPGCTPWARGSAPGPPAYNTPTATKLSQKPACSKAQGSTATTAAPASSHTSGQGQRRPPRRSSKTTASISTVRCAGTPQPLKTAYNAARARPPSPAATGAGIHWHRRCERRQAQPTSTTASHENIVMCRPEILIRWATPVARNTSQSARSMACWSPTSRAATTPAALAGAAAT